MIIRSLTMSVRERKQMENMQAQLEQLAANQDYIAMMCDVELEESEGEDE